jgi:Fe-S cluster biosynthesis and repair protein YggX
MPAITCTRCGQTRDQIAFRPFQNDLGLRVFQQICAACWAEWNKTQQQLINHYSLNVRDPQAKEFLFKQMEGFLFPAAGEVSDLPVKGEQ